MRILFSLDTEEALDPIDALGTFLIEDDEGRCISEDFVFIDDWLNAFVSGLEANLDTNVLIEIDLNSEPDPLSFSKDNEGILIKYRTNAVRIRRPDDFRKKLKEVIIEITDQYISHQNWAEDSLLSKLRTWALAGATL